MKRDAAICLAVARIVAERREGGAVRALDLPDQRERNEKAVELIAADERGEIALEHTVIESFGGQIASGIKAKALAWLVDSKLGDLPIGAFHLVVDPTALPLRGVGAVAVRLAAAVTEVSSSLAPGRPGTQGQHVCGLVGFSHMTPLLYRWPGPSPGRLDVRFAPPAKLEKLRARRVAKAADDKIDKLLAAAGEDRLSVLVLEDQDVALSNPALVAGVVESSLRTVERTPDVVFLVETVDGSASGCFLKEGEDWFPNVDATRFDIGID